MKRLSKKTKNMILDWSLRLQNHDKALEIFGEDSQEYDITRVVLDTIEYELFTELGVDIEQACSYLESLR